MALIENAVGFILVSFLFIFIGFLMLIPLLNIYIAKCIISLMEE